MTIAIRSATPEDLGQITAIYAHAVIHGTASYELEPPSRDEMATRFDTLTRAGYPYIVAERDGTILGYAYAGPFRARRAYRFMVEDSIYVDPAAKGQGVGLALIHQLICECEKLGFRQIAAVIGDGETNGASIGLHEKAGFAHSGILKGSGYNHGRWLDTVFMQLALNGGRTTPPDAGSIAERL